MQGIKWQDKLYCFTCFPNGPRSWPRKFAKSNKLSITNLRFANVPLSVYIDEFFPKGYTFSIREENIRKAMRLYESLKLLQHKEFGS